MGGRGSSSQSSAAAGVVEQFRQFADSHDQGSRSLVVTQSIDMANAAADLVESGRYRQLLSNDGFKDVREGVRRVYGTDSFRALSNIEKIVDPRLRAKPTGVSQETYEKAVKQVVSGMAAVESAGFTATDAAALIRFMGVFKNL